MVVPIIGEDYYQELNNFSKAICSFRRRLQIKHLVRNTKHLISRDIQKRQKFEKEQINNIDQHHYNKLLCTA